MFERMTIYEQAKKDYEKGIVQCPYSSGQERQDWISGWSYACHNDKDITHRNEMWEKWNNSGQDFGV